MKKKNIKILTVMFIIIIIIVAYKVIGGNSIKNKTYNYLESKGYVEDDIYEIEIKHSFLNKLLSYNEWRVFVEFKSEPGIIFAFTYRNKEIVRQGVTSTPLLDKDEILEYEKKLENGELKI